MTNGIHTVIGIDEIGTVDNGDGILVRFNTDGGPVALAIAHENVPLLLLDLTKAASVAARERGGDEVDTSKGLKPLAVTGVQGGTTSDNDLWFALSVQDSRIDFLFPRSLRSLDGRLLIEVLHQLTAAALALPERKAN